MVNSLTLESSQYAYTVGEEVVRFTERDYMLISEALMLALHEYTNILVDIHDGRGEESDTRDWLKPCKLVELAGIPAADVLNREIAEEKLKEKRKSQREKLRQKARRIVMSSVVGKSKSRAPSCLGSYKTADPRAAPKLPQGGRVIFSNRFSGPVSRTRARAGKQLDSCGITMAEELTPEKSEAVEQGRSGRTGKRYSSEMRRGRRHPMRETEGKSDWALPTFRVKVRSEVIHKKSE